MRNHLIHLSLVLMLFLTGFFPLSNAGAIVEIKILKYGHSEDNLVNGDLCDHLFGEKQSSCDPQMTMCIGSHGYNCGLLQVKHTRMRDTSHFYFADDPSSAPTFILKQRKLSRYFFIKIIVQDIDMRNSLGHQLIATFKDSFPPSVNKASHRDLMSDDNLDIDALSIQVNVTCEKHFYGNQCDKECRPTSVNQYCSHSGELRCKNGWYGQTCSQQPCYVSNPCQNGGKCQINLNGKFCQCPPGYKGLHCEFENPCNSSPCMNGGTCLWTDGRQRYSCKCSTHFNGSLCHRYIPCLSNPCLNGGKCKQGIRNEYLWQCDCPPGYEIPQCRVPDLCRSSPCRNSGKCTTRMKNGKAEFVCNCPSSYTGQQCEKRYVSCKNHKCFNGGTCVEKSDFEIECRCANSFRGEKCEIQSTTKLNITTKLSASTKTDEKFHLGDDQLLHGGRQVLNTAVIVVLGISGGCLFALIIAVVMITKRRKRKDWQVSQDKLMQSSVRTEDANSNITVPLPRLEQLEAEENPPSTRNDDQDDVQFAFL